MPENVFSDAEYDRNRDRILKLKDKWLAPLGLLWWQIELEYSREPLLPDDAQDRKDDYCTLARCYAKWQYMRAKIVFNMVDVARLDDEALERTFVHECMHVLVNEMRYYGEEGGLAHEERVVCTLTNAFLWVRKVDRSAERGCEPEDV